MRYQKLLHLLFPSLILTGFYILARLHDEQREDVEYVNTHAKLHPLASAMMEYYDKYKSLPPPYLVNSRNESIHSWRVLLLEFLDPDNFSLYDFNQPWNSEHNKKIEKDRASSFYCTKNQVVSHFYAVVGEKTL